MMTHTRGRSKLLGNKGLQTICRVWLANNRIGYRDNCCQQLYLIVYLNRLLPSGLPLNSLNLTADTTSITRIMKQLKVITWQIYGQKGFWYENQYGWNLLQCTQYRLYGRHATLKLTLFRSTPLYCTTPLIQILRIFDRVKEVRDWWGSKSTKRTSAPLYRHWGSVQVVKPIGE